MTQRLHHMAFRCRCSEETRRFYEEVIGLPLVGALPIEATATGRKVHVLHTFFAMKDGSHLAFFEVPDSPFDFKAQHDFDLHMALEADQDDIDRAVAEARKRGLEVRGPSDHGFIRSTYFRDPNGYVIELAAKVPGKERDMDPKQNHARDILDGWQASKRQPARVA